MVNPFSISVSFRDVRPLVILSSQGLRQHAQAAGPRPAKVMPVPPRSFRAVVCNGFQIINGSAAE
jgi:hypothetical protein